MSREERQSRPESASGTEPARRGLGFDSAQGPESIYFGCSMLSRIRLRPKNPKALVPMRCSLGYALHSNEEVARCLGVEGPSECWKTVQNWRVPAVEPQQKVAASRIAAVAVAEHMTTTSNGHVVAEVLIEQSVEVEAAEFVHMRSRADDAETD
jgi:hypothetical protein